MGWITSEALDNRDEQPEINDEGCRGDGEEHKKQDVARECAGGEHKKGGEREAEHQEAANTQSGDNQPAVLAPATLDGGENAEGGGDGEFENGDKKEGPIFAEILSVSVAAREAHDENAEEKAGKNEEEHWFAVDGIC